MKTYQEFLTEGRKKPKNEFPQGKKSYNTSTAAKKAGDALLAANPEHKFAGTFSVAVMMKSGKYILSWIDNKDASIGYMGGKFIDAGHSSTTIQMFEKYEKKGNQNWELDGDYVLRWVL